MKKITAIQDKTFRYIVDYIGEHGCQPSLQDMSSHFGVTIRTISDRLMALEVKGYITKTGKASRSLKILKGTFQYNEETK